LLIDRLDGHEAHAWTRRCFANGRRIVGVVFPPFAFHAIWADEVTGDQPRLQSHGRELARPVMRAAAGFHRNQNLWWQLRAPRDKPLSSQCLGNDHTA